MACLFPEISICPDDSGADLLSCSSGGSSLVMEVALTLTPPPRLTADLFPVLLDLLSLWPGLTLPLQYPAYHKRMPSLMGWPQALEPCCMVSDPVTVAF